MVIRAGEKEVKAWATGLTVITAVIVVGLIGIANTQHR
jgi:hypothetical protein